MRVTIHGTVSVVVRQDGEVVSEETYPNETEKIYRIELPEMRILGSKAQM